MNYFGQDGDLGWLKLESEKDKDVSRGLSGGCGVRG